MIDVAVIGCGIVGAACAYELSHYDIKITVFESENDVAMGTTKANSAIIHAGYDPSPGTLMAKLDVEGVKLAKELCEKLDIPYRHCGAFVLALNDDEVNLVERLYNRAIKNGVEEVAILNREDVLKLEPNVNNNVITALHAPTAMIVDPWEYTLALAETAARNSAEILLEHKVTRINEINGGYEIQTSKGAFEARTIINAAGLYADDIHNMIAEPEFTITPAKGEYWLLDKSEGTRVNSVIFQCPSKAGKGVLVTPTVHGNLMVGPGNISADSKDDVSTTADELEFVKQTAGKSVPGIDFSAVIRTFSGNRAHTENDDFIIKEVKPGFIDLAGIKSPGLTAAPAIAKMAAEMLTGNGMSLINKQGFIDSRRHIRFNKLNPEEKSAVIKKNPAYGHVICRCETVTEGEILDALESPIPPRSIDAVKRRTGAGMGRCQGGFCGPRILEILAKHYKCDFTDILQDKAGTYILTSKTKEDNL
ncbi:MAG: NAD(P)/FAD-dependent oxidoreductase [Oscillospiraceae bacterium]|nr:NAD(P)/FAD-dependent oxidoreductase [Oscillospiraceae bacterium]